MEFKEPVQSLYIEGVIDIDNCDHFANPLNVHRWVCYTIDGQPLSLQGSELIGINSLLIEKPMGLESPLLFRMCAEGSKIFRATLFADYGAVKLTMKIESAHLTSAILSGQSLISRYGRETIHIQFEKMSLLVQSTADTKTNQEQSDPLSLFQEYADLRDAEEEQDLRERVLANYRNN